MAKKVLGKGLSALIPEDLQEKVSQEGVSYLRIDKLFVGGHQPREAMNEDALEELMNSVKHRGILQPILARKKEDKFEVIAGARRLEAARRLGMEEIPVLIKDMNDKDALVVSMIENLQREDLNPLEEAVAFQKMIDEYRFTQSDIADVIGRNRSSVANTLRLLRLSDEIKQALSEGKITAGHARCLLTLEDGGRQQELLQLIDTKGLSVRQLEELVSNYNIKTMPSKARKKRAGKGNDPYVAELEERLQRALGTKVKIVHGKKRGKISIEYYSLEDLDRIVERLINEE